MKHDRPPVIAALSAFDQSSGSLLERALFNNRLVILLVCLAATLLLGVAATNIRLSANFAQMIPLHEPYIVNYLDHYDNLSTLSDAVQIGVEANDGVILSAHYISVLRKLNDEVYLLPGVNRPFEQSLVSRQTRWYQVTPDGGTGGVVVDDDYDGSPRALQAVAQHIQNAGLGGQLIGFDFKSTKIYVPLLLKVDGKPMDYGPLAQRLERIRRKYDAEGVTLRITGNAMVAGGMIVGIDKILGFFLVSIVVTAGALFWYTRCIRSAALVVAASLIAVVWQLGLLDLLGIDLTPYSVLVPFLVFAIGMSHGAQKMNGVMQDIGRGTHRLIAARYTFRRLFLAGFVALICDATSFAVLLVIRIGAIQQLAIAATLGVALLVVTNLILIPVVLSYIGVSAQAAARSERAGAVLDGKKHPVWSVLDLCTRRAPAAAVIAATILLTIGGYAVGRHVQIGDLQAGAPEFRQNSPYNTDNRFLLRNYALGSDSLVVLVDTPLGACLDYITLSTMERLQWQVMQMPGVTGASSIATAESYTMPFLMEGSPKWFGLEPDDALLNQSEYGLNGPLKDFACSFVPIYISLANHKAAILTGLVNAVSAFIQNPANQGPGFKMSLLAGNAGIIYATNLAVANANSIMLLLIYAVVIVFSFIAFRSWRAVLCAVIPLAVTSVLVQALMVWLNIGIKVATLPVLALGVGIGVDYALYVLTILLNFLRAGLPLSEAYYETLKSTGKVVLLTGFTLTIGVGTWIFAPVKFQADMGLLLSFMFLWNMLGAMVLLPALACFLLPVETMHMKAPG